LLFEEFLKNWVHHGPLILNLKSEGLEETCIDLMRFYDIKNWFFLDMSMPFFVRFSLIAKKKTLKSFSSHNLAVRFSDLEPIEYALSFSGKVKWLWVDTFIHFPLNDLNYKEIKDAKFKICIVSPELQGGSKEDILDLKSLIRDYSIDAVCTKFPDLWY
jgi:hypothetical protein